MLKNDLLNFGMFYVSYLLTDEMFSWYFYLCYLIKLAWGGSECHNERGTTAKSPLLLELTFSMSQTIL